MYGHCTKTLQLLFDVQNGKIYHGSVRKGVTVHGSGDWDFQLRKDRIDSFSRDEFDAYCQSLYRKGVITHYKGQNQKKLGNLQTWEDAIPYIGIHGETKEGKRPCHDFLQRYLDIASSKDWRIINDDGNFTQVTCQTSTHYYYMRFATS